MQMQMSVVFLPENNMILLGRGKACNFHPGNLRMRSIINKYKEQYRNANKGSKAKLVRIVYDELVNGGMKFMKQSEGEDGWVPVDADAAIQKVGHALRNKPKAAGIDRSRMHENSGKPTGEGRLQCTSSSVSIANMPMPAIGQHEPATMPFYLWSRLPLPDIALRNDGITDQSLMPKRRMPASSMNSNPINEELSQYSISTTGALQQNVTSMVPPRTTGLPSTGDLLLSLGRPLQPRITVGFAEHGAGNLLEQYLAVERLQSTLSPPSMGSFAHSGQQPLYSTNQVYTSAEHDLLVSLTKANRQFQSHSVPNDDPLFWIRLAAASLLNTGP